MNDPHRSRTRRIAGVVALGAGAAGAALWALQHRRVARAMADAAGADLEAEGLVLPDDVVHHVVETDDGGRIHVAERGDGPPLVLLHGFMLDSSIWAHQFRDLALRRRVVAIDHRGHGSSEPGTSGFGGRETAFAHTPSGGEGLADAARVTRAGAGAPAIGRLAADLGRVLEELDLERVLVVGHSMGGMVTLQLAHDDPMTFRRRVAGIVLVSTTAGPFLHLPGWAGLAGVAAPASSRGVLLAERLGVRAMPSRDLRWWLSRLGFGADATAAQVQYLEALHVSTSSRTLAGLLPSLALFDLSAGLGSVEVPALVVVGSHDHLTTTRRARRMANALPLGELVELARCGHMPMIERPHEFAHILEEFSAKVVGE